MVNRLVNPLKTHSFFLFGARGTGKSTLVREELGKNVLNLDLLDPEVFDRFLVRPKSLEETALSGKYDWIILDEVQRVPKLLDIVHRMIEKTGQKFALTGSSTRKLKRGGANLLAGRAFVNTLFPFTTHELKGAFNLEHALQWGTLPRILGLNGFDEKKSYLRTYCLTFIKEEIQAEQVVRRLEPFREFLTVAAQSSGKIINYSSIGRDVGAQVPTVQNYFQILEDTYVGFMIPHFHRSIRKSQISAPKFYFFDNGVKKSLEGSLDAAPTEGTSAFGELFEAFVIQEIFRLNQYCEKDYRLSYFRTKNNAEVDLILSKGRQIFLIEIKSSRRVDEVSVRKLARVAESFGKVSKIFYLSRDPDAAHMSGVHCIFWQKFLEMFRAPEF